MTDRAARLAALDHAHLWHPFTPMKQWRETEPLIIERGDGPYLIDTAGNRYIDGVSSLWCNVHGHRVERIDRAIRDQLDRIAHSTLLGLASPPSIELAAQLCAIAPAASRSESRSAASGLTPQGSRLTKVFYSDAGATAVEVALKMAVGYWHHRGRPQRNQFISFRGAYHGDTTGSMSIGFSELFHRPFATMVFPTTFTPVPDACRSTLRPKGNLWPSEDPELMTTLGQDCLAQLAELLERQGVRTAAIIIEPIMQGAAGMMCQPSGFLRGVAELARQHEVLLIADEVATGFGRTGTMFACQQEGVEPDILCLAKGITGGYLPLAATLATDEIEQAFCGEPAQRRTLYHGHTYTGNALACAAALASLTLFEETRLLDHIRQSTQLIRLGLDPLRSCPNVLDIRQRGLMVGIELCRDRSRREPFDFSRRTGAAVCQAMRGKGLIVRPLGDVMVLMPIPAMDHDVLKRMLAIVVQTLLDLGGTGTAI